MFFFIVLAPGPAVVNPTKLSKFSLEASLNVYVTRHRCTTCYRVLLVHCSLSVSLSHSTVAPYI